MKEMNVVEIEDDLTPEERAYWEASIEWDMREIAEGKPRKYISLEQFGEELRASIRRRL